MDGYLVKELGGAFAVVGPAEPVDVDLAHRHHGLHGAAGALAVGAAEDEDNPAADESHWANATIGVPPLKVPGNAKFDRDVVDWFKRQGRGYQTRMNAVLRKYMEAQSKAV